MKPSHKVLLSLLNRPWAHFFLFVLFNAWMSWNPLSVSAPFQLFILGIFLLLLLAIAQPVPSTSKPLWSVESLPPVPSWFWILLLLLALVARLYRLTTIPVWPVTDEGSAFLNAIHLARHWDGRLFFGLQYNPPCFFWLLAVFFKVLPPSLFSLWFFSALVSLATLAAGYAACRIFFSRSLSFLWAMGWAFSFWPLYISHFTIAPILIPFWGCCCVFLLGLCMKATSFSSRMRQWFFLGAGLGLGFCIFYTLWFSIALLIGSALLLSLRSIRPPRQKRILLLQAGLPITLLAVLLFIFRLNLPNEVYLGHLWAFQKDFSWPAYLKTAASYLTSVFWGADSSIDYFAYKPFGGGFLNPLLGGLLFVGVIELFQQRRHPAVRWLGWGFLLLIVPAVLTNNLEMFRIISILPLLLLVVALGFQALLGDLEGGKRIVVVVLISLCSFGLDFYRLVVVYPQFWNSHIDQWDSYAKQRECYDAYQALNTYQKTKGPGLILTEFGVPLESSPREQSLVLACYSFDAARNPRIGAEKARWMALFVASPELSFLRRKLPDAVWYELGPDLYRLEPNDRYFMTILPIRPQNEPAFRRWSQANDFLEEMVYQSLNPISTRFREKIQSQMLQNYGLFQGDPFLETHFWTTLAGNFKKEENLQGEWRALQLGLQRGYPRPPKYYYLVGYWLFKAKHYVFAREAYLTAARLDPLFTPPKEARRELDRLANREEQNEKAVPSLPTGLPPPEK